MGRGIRKGIVFLCWRGVLLFLNRKERIGMDQRQLEEIEKVSEKLVLTGKQSDLMRKYMEELVLTEEESQLVFKYLIGEAGDEVFAELPVQDLSKSAIQGSGAEIFRVLPLETAGKVFQVLYAVGGSSCSGMFSLEELMKWKGKKGVWIEANQIAAFAADYVVREYRHYLCYSLCRLNVREWIESVLEVIGGESGAVLKALEEYRGGVGGRIFLWTIYFLMKYPEAELGKETVLSKGDREYLTWYENCVFVYLKEVLERKKKRTIEKEAWDRIETAFRSPNLSKEFIKSLGKMETDDFFSWNSALVFVNCALSDCFRNIVAFWLEEERWNGDWENSWRWDGNWALLEMLDFRRDLELRGGFFVEWFGVEIKQYLALAAKSVVDSYRENYVVKKKDSVVKGWRNTLSVLFQQYPEVFSQYCEEFFTQKPGRTAWEKRKIWQGVLLLYEVMEEQDLKFFRGYLQKVQSIQKEQMIVWIAEGQKDEEVKEGIRRYLEEEAGLEEVFFIRDRLEFCGMAAFVIVYMLESYHRFYEDSIFCYRYLIYAVLCQKYQELDFFWKDLGERVIRTFQMLELEGFDLDFQINMMLQWREEQEKEKRQAFESAVKPVFLEYLKAKREETITGFLNTDIYGRYFLLLLFEQLFLENKEEAERNKEVLFGLAQDMAGLVKDKLVELFSQRREWKEEIKGLLLSKRVTEREVAVRVLEAWGEEEELKLALEKEKNKKLKALLEGILCLKDQELEGIDGEDGLETVSLQNMVQQLHKKDKKQSLQWAYQTPFSAVKRKDGELASERYLQAIFLAYSFMESCGVSEEARVLAAELEADSFAVYVCELFEKWLQSGAEAKKKWVLFVMAVYGGSGVEERYSSLIQEWIKQGRGALASEAVKALALHPSSQALFLVDDIARKVKHKQVKAAAFWALEMAALQLGITKEELADRIVPNLGFQSDGKRIFDYGGRKFTVFLSIGFELEVMEESGKKLKSLPAPGKRDDSEKAAAAYEEWKQVKKQMKTAVNSQKLRLEQVFLSGRKWEIAAWKKLFLENPLMVSFAVELIWGVYQEGRLVQSFRYMGDGTFATGEEEEFVLPETGKIGLVHPIELSKEEKTIWREQMEDYEIVQPIEQLDRVIFELSEEEEQLNSLERFGGFCMGDMQLSRKILSLGWERGTIWDAGSIFCYNREDLEVGWGVELYFSGGYVGWDSGEEVTLYDARFYRIGENREDEYGYGKVGIGKGAFLTEVPRRYFSEIVRQLSLVTASCGEREENWREKRKGV